MTEIVDDAFTVAVTFCLVIFWVLLSRLDRLTRDLAERVDAIDRKGGA